jgi:hypothetical protein
MTDATLCGLGVSLIFGGTGLLDMSGMNYMHKDGESYLKFFKVRPMSQRGQTPIPDYGDEIIVWVIIIKLMLGLAGFIYLLTNI